MNRLLKILLLLPAIVLVLPVSGNTSYYSDLYSANQNPLNVRVLDLSNRSLTEFPQEILSFTYLEELNLSNNNITEFPPALLQLPNLKVLNLSNNGISYLSDEFFDPETVITAQPVANVVSTSYSDAKEQKRQSRKNKQATIAAAVTAPEVWTGGPGIEVLILKENNLQQLPETISNLVNLKELDLKFNLLTALPKSLSNMNLQRLSASHNKFYNPTTELSVIAGIESLIFLDYSSNKMYSVPENFGNLINLEECDIGYNKFETLPETIANLKKLKRLSINVNQIDQLPNGFLRVRRTGISGYELQQLCWSSRVFSIPGKSKDP